MNNKNIKKIIIVLLILSFLDLGLSSILTLAKYNNSISQICGETSKDNSCEIVQNSKYSDIMTLISKKNNNNYNKKIELPLSLLGVIYYIIFIIYLIRYFYNKNIKSNNNKFLKYIFFYSLIGFISSIIFTLIQTYLIKAYCKFCITSAIITSIIFIISTYLYLKIKLFKNEI